MEYKEKAPKNVKDSLYYYGVSSNDFDELEQKHSKTEKTFTEDTDQFSLYHYQTLRSRSAQKAQVMVVPSRRVQSAQSAQSAQNVLLTFSLFLRSMVTSFREIRLVWFLALSLVSFSIGLLLWEQIGLRQWYYQQNPVQKLSKLGEFSPLQFQVNNEVDLPQNQAFAQELQMKSYVVEKGDTLLELAIRFKLNVDTLVSVNNIQDATLLQYGRDLLVPSSNGIIHTVSRRDTIDGIAKKYNTPASAILDINDVRNALLVPGHKLFVPDAKLDQFELGLILGTVFYFPTRGVLSSGYGYRISPITKRRHFHAAIDIANVRGTKIYAAATGTVSYVSGNNPVYGKAIEIRHPNGYKTLYSHLSKIYVRKGSLITRGSVIGLMGNTGFSTGSHLHFSITKNGRAVNPLRYVKLR